MKIEHIEAKSRLVEKYKTSATLELKKAAKDWAEAKAKYEKEREDLALLANKKAVGPEAMASTLLQLQKSLFSQRLLKGQVANLEALKGALGNKIKEAKNQLNALTDRVRTEKLKAADLRNESEVEDLLGAVVSMRVRDNKAAESLEDKNSASSKFNDTLTVAPVSSANAAGSNVGATNEPNTAQVIRFQNVELKGFSNGTTPNLEVSLTNNTSEAANLKIIQESEGRVSVEVTSPSAALRGEILRNKSSLKSSLEKAGLKVGQFFVGAPR